MITPREKRDVRAETLEWVLDLLEEINGYAGDDPATVLAELRERIQNALR